MGEGQKEWGRESQEGSGNSQCGTQIRAQCDDPEDHDLSRNQQLDA